MSASVIRARRFAGSAALAALLLLHACQSPAPGATTGPTAECPVCKHEGDLACLSVAIEADTPRCASGGETYYFCSDECREDFVARPEQYLPQR